MGTVREAVGLRPSGVWGVVKKHHSFLGVEQQLSKRDTPKETIKNWGKDPVDERQPEGLSLDPPDPCE